MITLTHRINTFKPKLLKRTFIIILNSSMLFLFGCKKESKQPQAADPIQDKVWCFYQTNFGNKAFLYCAKSEAEMQSKQQECINNQLQISIEVKSNCNECQ